MEPVKPIVYKNKCCVSGCDDRTSKRHRFPKDAKFLKKWVENTHNLRLTQLSPSEICESYFVCHRHFQQEYLVPGSRRRLRRDAVPTLHLPGKVPSAILVYS